METYLEYTEDIIMGLVYDRDMVEDVLDVIYDQVFISNGYIAHGLMYNKQGDLIYPKSEFMAVFFRFWEENAHSEEPLTDDIVYLNHINFGSVSSRDSFIELVSDKFSRWLEEIEPDTV